MTDANGSDRLARMEAVLEAVRAAVESHGEVLEAVGATVNTHGELLRAVTAKINTHGEILRAHGEMLGTVRGAVSAQAETTALGFQTLTDMMRVLDARMVVLDDRMTELTSRVDDHLRGHGTAA